jgi:hypothetical protein
MMMNGIIYNHKYKNKPKKHEVKELENVFMNEINLDASKPKLNMFKIPKKLNYTI